MDLETESPLRTTDDPAVMREWAEALHAEGIPFRIEVQGTQATLVTHVDDAERAVEALRDLDDDRAEPPRVAPPAYGRNWAGAIAAWLLLAIFFVTGPPSPGEIWFERGVVMAREALAWSDRPTDLRPPFDGPDKAQAVHRRRHHLGEPF